MNKKYITKGIKLPSDSLLCEYESPFPPYGLEEMWSVYKLSCLIKEKYMLNDCVLTILYFYALSTDILGQCFFMSKYCGRKERTLEVTLLPLESHRETR